MQDNSLNRLIIVSHWIKIATKCQNRMLKTWLWRDIYQSVEVWLIAAVRFCSIAVK